MTAHSILFGSSSSCLGKPVSFAYWCFSNYLRVLPDRGANSPKYRIANYFSRLAQQLDTVKTSIGSNSYSWICYVPLSGQQFVSPLVIWGQGNADCYNCTTHSSKLALNGATENDDTVGRSMRWVNANDSRSSAVDKNEKKTASEIFG